MHQRGYALLTAIIFLVILTGVAVTALRSSGLELRMSSNNALRTESFEASESPRLITGELLDIHTFNRGWPASLGGDVADAEFDYPIPTGFAIPTPVKNWYVNNSDEAGNCATPFRDASEVDCTLISDASYARDLAATGQSSYPVRSDMSVFKLRVDLSPGSGTAMLAGYEGTGRSVASSGGRIFFYVQSTGYDAAPTAADTEAQTRTGAMYRHVIRN